jgi:hypothetical protein
MKYNGFGYLQTGLLALLPAAALIAGCSSEPPKSASAAAPAAAAAEEAPAEAAPANQDAAANAAPVTDVAQARAAAGDLSLREDAPLVYVVKKGDTLWGIAGYFLQDPWQWPQLWYDNSQIKNPHLIYPGDQLRLVWVSGQPRLTRMTPANVTRLSPSAREVPLEEAVPTIPIDAIRHFLRAPRLVTVEQLKQAPYIVDFVEEHIAAGANDSIYVKNLPDGRGTWAVVEPGDPYVDPETGEVLGYEAIPVGNATVTKYGQPATLKLTTGDHEAQIGNRLLPLESEDFSANFMPHAPAKPVNGRIMSVFGGVAEISQFQIIAINRGTRDGVDAGTVLSILQAGKVVSDPYGGSKGVQLPDLYAGTLMVFKTTPRLSYALVLKEKRAAHLLDKVAKPALGDH